jgi:predicted anti-sigma-YlaC factor YlaD
MKCEEIRERMPEVAAGFGEFTSDESNHLASCAACTEQLKAMRATMSVLDEWQVPEPSLYFDVRLQARLREEMAKPQAGWLHWFRRPVLAAALTVIMGVGIGVYFATGNGKPPAKKDVPIATNITADPGSAVGDLQTLDKNDDMYANFELLDDLDLQQNVDETPQNADN